MMITQCNPLVLFSRKSWYLAKIQVALNVSCSFFLLTYTTMAINTLLSTKARNLTIEGTD